MQNYLNSFYISNNGLGASGRLLVGVWDVMDAFKTDLNKGSRNKERVSSGLKELDNLLHGGLPVSTVTLVSGTPGSGKSILCYHYLDAGLRSGEKCLYLTSDERVENILRQADELGFQFGPFLDSGQLKFKYLDLDKSTVHKEMEEEIRMGGFCRVVLDSLTPLAETPVWTTRGGNEIIPMEDAQAPSPYPLGSTPATRVHVRRIMSILSNDACTAMVTSEIPEGARCLSRDSVSEFLVDGILLLDLDVTMDRRKLTVRKMRGTGHTLKPQNIAITEKGIKFS